MGIKQHNGNTKADRLAELKIRSPSIQLIKFGAIGLNAIIFSPLLIAADTGSQYGTNITINDGDRITGDTADPSGNLYSVMTPAGNTPGNINLGNDVTVNVNDASGYAKGIIIQGKNSSLTAKEGANKQVISSQVDSLIKISRIWADFFPANTSNQPI